ncbi:unnamed protein product, partial [Prorocentrum cordatum]
KSRGGRSPEAFGGGDGRRPRREGPPGAMSFTEFEIDGRLKDPEQQEKLELREEELRQAHGKYLQKHPELRQVLNDFMSSVLLHRPDQVFDFAKEYFSAFKQSDSDAAQEQQTGDAPDAAPEEAAAPPQ